MLMQPIMGILIQQHQQGWSIEVRTQNFSRHWLGTSSFEEHFTGFRLTVGAMLIHSHILHGRVGAWRVTYRRPHTHWGIEPGFEFKPSDPITQTSSCAPEPLVLKNYTDPMPQPVFLEVLHWGELGTVDVVHPCYLKTIWLHLKSENAFFIKKELEKAPCVPQEEVSSPFSYSSLARVWGLLSS